MEKRFRIQKLTIAEADKPYLESIAESMDEDNYYFTPGSANFFLAMNKQTYPLIPKKKAEQPKPKRKPCNCSRGKEISSRTR